MEYINCNLCGADDTRILYKTGRSNVVMCKKCGLIYKNPRPSEEKALFRQDIDECRDDREILGRKQIFTWGICEIESIIGKGKILDAGCGYGEFLKIARERGWAVQGIEVSSKCCRFASETYGLNVFQGTLKQANFPEGYFDVVTMWDSLDFMYNPQQELLEAYRVLKFDGLLFIRVRNAKFHIPVKRIFRNSRAIVHQYSFSPRAIKLMLEKVGFRKIKVMNSIVTQDIPFSLFLNLMMSFLDYVSNAHVILSPSILTYARK